MINKDQIYKSCLLEIERRIRFYEELIVDLNKGSGESAKSSAGDKHETAVAMVHLEQQKHGQQLKELLDMKVALNKIKQVTNTSLVLHGSLIKTTIGWFYIAVGLGKISMDNNEVYVLSPNAPLGIKLLSAKRNEKISFNGKEIFIEELY